jgi:hypothetical protein
MDEESTTVYVVNNQQRWDLVVTISNNYSYVLQVQSGYVQKLQKYNHKDNNNFFLCISAIFTPDNSVSSRNRTFSSRGNPP